jgi:uncharacterized protein YggU (UPF0235/DUF167 family)
LNPAAGTGALDLRPDGTGCLLKVKVTPRGSANTPVEGAANDAAREFLAALLGLPRRAVELARGQTNRAKVFRIEGLDPSSLRARLDAVIGT